jgi:hypothetical protein
MPFKWVKRWLCENDKFTHTPLLTELKENNPNDFKNYLGMDEKALQCLLNLVKCCLIKQGTRMRKSITPEERLFATLC